MSRYVPFLLVVGWLLPQSTSGQPLPPGYGEVVQVTNDNAFNRWPRVNNRGQMVFSKRFNPMDPSTGEIYLYEGGALKRLTDDNVRDDFPDINEAGEIAWSRAIGANGTFEIVLYRTGQLVRLTDDELDDYTPSINSYGQIACAKMTELGCGRADADIYLYDGQTIRRITDGWLSNQSPDLNDLGDIVWTRYNFCNHPYTSEIMLYSEGVTRPLTGDQGEPRVPRINNRRVAAWLASDPPRWSHRIMTWKDGVYRELTDWGSGLSLNNRGDGDIVFDRWHEDSRTWQVWLHRDGQFWQVTRDPFWNCSGELDDRGNMYWVSGDLLDTDIKQLRRLWLGDLNCDGVVNNFDIDPFVVALTNPLGYALVYPKCDRTLADVNLDGRTNNFDIDPFLKVLRP